MASEARLKELAETCRLSAADYAARARASEGLDRSYFDGLEKSYLALAAMLEQTAADSARRLALSRAAATRS
jgi:hypothetical protein